MRQLILDTETTGLDPKEGHRMVEFAALEMIDRKLTGKYLHLYINPERAIDEGAARIHGITDEMVADKPKFADVVDEIHEFITGAELIIHNAKFDLGFMDYQFNLEQKPKTQSVVANVIDTLMIARQKFPGSKNNLDALCDRFKVDRSSRGYHGALIDCELLAHVYLALTREQISLLADDEVKNNFNSVEHVFTQIDTSHLNLKVIESSSVEAELHDGYLSKLDKLTTGKSAWYNLTQEQKKHVN